MKIINEKSINEKLLKDAQFRKGLSIAFFNATNSAIEMIKAQGDVTKEAFIEWRDWFLSEHAKYYAETIAKIGLPYNPQQAIEKLRATNNAEEFKKVWLELSEDERRNEVIIKVIKELQDKYYEKI